MVSGIEFTPAEVESIKRKILKCVMEDNYTFAAACAKAGIGHSTAYDWKAKDPLFKEQCRMALLHRDDVITDLAEGALAKNIKDGKEASIFFHLKTKGKPRGYIEKTEVDLNHAGVVEFTLDFRDSGVIEDNLAGGKKTNGGVDGAAATEPAE